MNEANMKPTILLESDSSRDYYHVTGRIVVSDTQELGYVGTVRNPLDEWYSDLQLRTQGDMGAEGEERLKLYGWGLCFKEPHYLELADLRKMTRGLGTLERKLRKMAEVEGPCESFWQYVNRVARALKAQIIVRKAKNGENYDDNEYRRIEAQDLPITIRGLQEKALGGK